jgi:cell division protein FtsB
VALTLAYPLRNYFEQRSALADVQAEQQALQQKISELEAQKAALNDPAYIAAEARRRLQYVAPGDTVYRIVLPAAPKQSAPATTAPTTKPKPWYGSLWDTLNDPSPAG